jgi:hypothetical protein
MPLGSGVGLVAVLLFAAFNLSTEGMRSLGLIALAAAAAILSGTLRWVHATLVTTAAEKTCDCAFVHSSFDCTATTATDLQAACRQVENGLLPDFGARGGGVCHQRRHRSRGV